MDQLILPNENINLFSSASSFLPLPTPLANRQVLSAVDNISSTITDNDLQRVPPSFMLIQPPSTYSIPFILLIFIKLINILGNGSTLHSQPQLQIEPQPQPQVVHSASRPNSMPSWRGYLPMQFDPVTMGQYQMITQFSQKVFLGGIPAELIEG
jgi:hypothetical protein